MDKRKGFMLVGICFVAVSIIMLVSFFGDIGDDLMLLYPIILLGVVGSGLIAASIVMRRREEELEVTRTRGTDGIGTYIRHNWEPGGTRHRLCFSIVFSYENLRGQTVETKSPPDYSEAEAKALAEMSTFQIKILGDKAVITAVPEIKRKPNISL